MSTLNDKSRLKLALSAIVLLAAAVPALSWRVLATSMTDVRSSRLGETESGAMSGESVMAAAVPNAPLAVATPVDVPILMYHYLTSADTPPDQYWVTQGMFERQMNALVAYGYDTVSLHDFMDYRNGAATPPDHPIILTFDDGHIGVYTSAFPILKDRSMRATLFVTTGWIGESEANRYGWCLVWDPELDTLSANGFPVEAHSVTHPNLMDLPPDQAWDEILGSRVGIEEHLGSQVQFFCYPEGYGAYVPGVRSLVEQAGYLAAVAAWPDGIANTATSDIWALPRVMIREDNSVDLDLEQPGRFFMRKVDPDFALPLITVNAVRFQHADGRSSACFTPGETVTATVTATNDGAAATTRLMFALDEDDEHSDPYYSELITEDLMPGATVTATFSVPLASGLSLGTYFYLVRFNDEYAVLGFQDTGWQPAFSLAEVRYQHYLPVAYR